MNTVLPGSIWRPSTSSDKTSRQPPSTGSGASAPLANASVRNRMAAPRIRPLAEPPRRNNGRHNPDAWAGYRPSGAPRRGRSEEHTSELQSLMRISYAVFCLKKKKKKKRNTHYYTSTRENIKLSKDRNHHSITIDNKYKT